MHCRYGLTLARHSGIITSLDLLAVLWLMQSRMCLPSLLLECSPLLAFFHLAAHQSLFHSAASHTAFTVMWVYSSCRTLYLLNLAQFLLSHLCMISLSSGPFTSSSSVSFTNFVWVQFYLGSFELDQT